MVRTYQPKKRQRSKEHGFRQAYAPPTAARSGSPPREGPRPSDPLMGPRMEIRAFRRGGGVSSPPPLRSIREKSRRRQAWSTPFR